MFCTIFVEGISRRFAALPGLLASGAGGIVSVCEDRDAMTQMGAQPLHLFLEFRIFHTVKFTLFSLQI
jgi:hypothetical protein